MPVFKFENQEVRLLRLFVKACLRRLEKTQGSNGSPDELNAVKRALRERIVASDSPLEQAMLVLVLENLRAYLSKAAGHTGDEARQAVIAEVVDDVAKTAQSLRV